MWVMTTRSCYQCGDDDISAIRQKRQAEIRAWADASIAEADANRGEGYSDWDNLPAPQTIPDDQEIPVVVEVEHVEADVLALTEEQPAHQEIIDASPKPEEQANVRIEKTAAQKKAAIKTAEK